MQWLVNPFKPKCEWTALFFSSECDQRGMFAIVQHDFILIFWEDWAPSVEVFKAEFCLDSCFMFGFRYSTVQGPCCHILCRAIGHTFSKVDRSRLQAGNSSACTLLHWSHADVRRQDVTQHHRAGIDGDVCGILLSGWQHMLFQHLRDLSALMAPLPVAPVTAPVPSKMLTFEFTWRTRCPCYPKKKKKRFKCGLENHIMVSMTGACRCPLENICTAGAMHEEYI